MKKNYWPRIKFKMAIQLRNKVCNCIRHRSGFTLIELMVTIAIVAVIAALAAPSFIDMLRKNQLNQVTYDFLDILNQTRSAAILQKKLLTIEIDGASGWQPQSDVIWDERQKPSQAIRFDFMGRTDFTTDFQCYILKNKANNNLKSIIILQKSGAVSLDRDAVNCPSSTLGE